MSLPTSANLSLSQINSCLRITNGNIGIGTTAPAYKLDIVGNVNATALSQAGVPLVSGSTFNAMSTFSTTATLTTTSPTDVEVSGQIGPVTIALPANNTSGNIITVHNVGGTTGSTSSDVFVRTGTSTTSGSLARISPGESVTTMALQTAGTTPSAYQKTISRKGGKGLEWTERSILNTRSWRGIAWAPELGLFCATTAGAAFVMTSPDGITWTERSIPNNRGWYGICWAPELGLFCSVNLGGAAFVMTSPDGITWTERSIPNTRNWISVVWAPELRLFCAVNNNSAAFVMTSPDGITWTERSIPATRAWRGLAWAPELGLFCASNDASAAVVMTSPNGITWTERAIPGNRQWFRLTWAPELGLFCAVNYASAAVVMTSPDGITWTERSIPNSRAWYDITWAPELGLFCAVVNGVAVVMTSPDGITWTERSIPNARAYISVVWAPELMSFCAIPDGGTAAVLTSFGVPLNLQTAPTSTTMGSTASLTTNTVSYTMGNFFTDTSGTGMYDYTLTANPQSSGSLSNGILTVTGNNRNTSYTITVTGRNGINKTAGSSLTVNESGGADLYSFTSHTFTNAGVTGRDGPTLTQIRTAYGGTWQQNSSYLNMTTQGVQLWTVPQFGNYAVTMGGAKGADVIGVRVNRSGGNGRIITGTMTLSKSQVLQLIVGQRGTQQTGQLGFGVVSLTTTDGAAGGGGGGGSFIVDNTNGSLILAAGGGGSGFSNLSYSWYQAGYDAPQSQYGTTMTGTIKNTNLGNGGTIGSFNANGGYGGGGGTGWLTNGSGVTGTMSQLDGINTLGGPNGGTKYQGGIAIYRANYGINNGDGGFGGGGGGGSQYGGNPGGGGGYSGGDGGDSNSGSGGGGGSFIGTIGSYAGTHGNHGFITIVRL